MICGLKNGVCSTDTFRVRQFPRGTYLPTAVFAALSQLVCWDPCGGVLSRLGPILTATAIVPFAWYLYVMRSGSPYLRRAALAGGTCAFLILALSHVTVATWFSATHSWSQLELGAVSNALSDLFVIGGALLVGAPAGAVVGVLVALIQQRWVRDLPDVSCANTHKLSQPLTAAMVAILASPLVALLAAHVLREPLLRLFPRSAVGLSALLAGTWAVTIPIAAGLGARLSTGPKNV